MSHATHDLSSPFKSYQGVDECGRWLICEAGLHGSLGMRDFVASRSLVFEMIDSYGDGWNNAYFYIDDENGRVAAHGGRFHQRSSGAIMST